MCSLVTLSKDYLTKRKGPLAEPFGQRLLAIFMVLSPFNAEHPHDKGSVFHKKPINSCKSNLERSTDLNNLFIIKREFHD